VVQISDGAVQTSGASVEVSKDGGAFTAGGGTLAVSNGIHSYTPTQGETDCDSLRINVYKSGCIPATAQAVFSASATFGYAGTDQSKIANPSSTQNLSGTTIKAVTDGVTVTTNNDKTGYSLTQAFPSNFASLAITAGGAVTVGTNNDKTGYALTQAFPSNFAALGINGSGHISRVTLVDTTTTNSDMRGTDNAALASNWTATRAGYLDSVLIAANSNRTVQVTGSHHVAADIHELQPAVIDNTHFAAGAIDSNALAASAATEIATAVASDPGFDDAIRAAIGMAAANLDTQLSAIASSVDPGAVWSDPDAVTTIRSAVGLASANLDSQLAAALVLQKLAASGATGSVQVTDNGNGTATLVFKDTNGSTTLATVTYNYTTGARTRVS
jgi:hypothetical protein